MKRAIVFKCFKALAAFCLVFATASAWAADAQPIRVGWQPSFQAEFYVARYFKLFKKVGLDPSFLKFNAGAPMFAALQTGSIDITYMGTPPALIAASQGVPAKTIYVELNGAKAEGLVARPDSGIKGICDLKGKRVAVRRGSSAAYGMMKGVQKCDFAFSDVDTLDMEITTIIPAFAKGDVDAVWVWEPWMDKLIAHGGKLIATDADAGARTGGVWVATDKWVKEKPEQVQKFFKLLSLAHEKMKKDPAGAAKAMAQYLAIPEKTARHIIDITDYPTAQEQWHPDWALSMNPKALQQGKGLASLYHDLGKFLADSHRIRKAPSTSELIDTEPLAAYIKSESSH